MQARLRQEDFSLRIAGARVCVARCAVRRICRVQVEVEFELNVRSPLLRTLPACCQDESAIYIDMRCNRHDCGASATASTFPCLYLPACFAMRGAHARQPSGCHASQSADRLFASVKSRVTSRSGLRTQLARFLTRASATQQTDRQPAIVDWQDLCSPDDGSRSRAHQSIHEARLTFCFKLVAPESSGEARYTAAAS